jgi:hypothetical protein
VSGQPAVLRCSFCNKDENEVQRLIAGPTVFICDECVEVCKDIVSGKYDRRSRWEESMGRLGDVSVAKALWFAGVSFVLVALWTWYNWVS